MGKCDNLKKKIDGKCYCRVIKKNVTPADCCSCAFRETKQDKTYKYTLKSKTTLKSSKNRLKSKTTKQRKLEDSRYSVFTTDLKHCYFCDGKVPKDDLHELLQGRNRSNSIKYGFVLPLCRYHHDLMHDDVELQEEWKQRCESYFISNIGTKEEFIDIFKRNYL